MGEELPHIWNCAMYIEICCAFGLELFPAGETALFVFGEVLELLVRAYDCSRISAQERCIVQICGIVNINVL